MKLKAPIIAIRDLEIQARESDLVAASFGRGFFVLDDYAALRGLTPQLLSQEGALFAPGRKARQYDEIGYYRAQGDNLASPNPPMGALLTYYLREDLPNAAAGAAGPKMVPTIADSTGKQVRQLDASSKAGLHRTPWDLREAAPAGQPGGRGTGQPAAAPPAAGGGQEAGTQPPPQGGRGGRGGRGGAGGGFGGRGFGRSGPPVKAGMYQVTLGKLADGTATPVGQPQTVEVVPLEK